MVAVSLTLLQGILQSLIYGHLLIAGIGLVADSKYTTVLHTMTGMLLVYEPGGREPSP